MLFYMKGYNLRTCTLKKLQKDQYILSKEMEDQISKDELFASIRKELISQGQVYFFTKKKEVKGVIIIGYEKHKASDFAELFKTDDNSSNQMNPEMVANAYVLKGLYLDDFLKEKEEEISEGILEELKEQAASNSLSVKVFIWKEKMILDNTIGKSSSSSIALGMSIGMMVGCLIGALMSFYHNNSMYIAYGVMGGNLVGLVIGSLNFKASGKKIADS